MFKISSEKVNKIELLYVLVMSRTRFRVNPDSIVAGMSRKSLLEAGAKSEGKVTATELVLGSSPVAVTRFN